MDIHSIYISLLIRNQGECPDTVLIMPVSMIMGKQNYFSPLFTFHSSSGTKVNALI
jgi:hypothetical protein